MRKLVLSLLSVLLFLACENGPEKKKFEWTEDIKQTVGNDLNEWLNKSPFNGKWNTTNNGEITFDNRAQVFPFMGKFKNENDDYKDFGYHSNQSDVYQQAVGIFKDSQFGESFVYAALLYEPEELFMTKSYSERGNPIFSGTNAINESYYARLSETMVFEKNEAYKATIYHVNSNNQQYLSGFCQKGKLIFQFAFPYTEKNKLTGLEKIKEINRALHLNIKAWENATVAELATNNNPKGFWKDPFIGIYMGNYLFPDLKVKIKHTDFEEINPDEKEVDFLFTYERNGKNYTLSFRKEKTTVNSLQYFESFGKTEFIPITDRDKKLFITKKEVIDGMVEMETETYFKNNHILKVKVSFPKNDMKAEKQIMDILANLRISMF